MLQATLSFLVISTLVVSGHAGPIISRHDSIFGAGGNTTYEDLSRRTNPIATGRHLLKFNNLQGGASALTALLKDKGLVFQIEDEAPKFHTFMGTFDAPSKNKLSAALPQLASQVTSFVEYNVRTMATVDIRKAPWPNSRVNSGLPVNNLGIPQSSLGFEVKYDDSSAGDCATIYVIDSGILHTHPEFQGTPGRVTWAGKNFVARGEDKTNVDMLGHGTQVASLIAGKTFGIAKRAKMIAIKVGNHAEMRGGDLILALNYVAERYKPGVSGLTIVNLSVGTDHPCDLTDSAVNDLVDMGVHVVVAGGNDGRLASERSPGRAKGSIVVGGSTFDDHLWAKSAHGPRIDIIAPAHLVPAASLDGTDTTSKPSSGTSLATGLLSGILAYVGCDPELMKMWPLPHAGPKTAQLLRDIAGKAGSPHLLEPGLQKNLVTLIAYMPRPLTAKQAKQAAKAGKP